MACFFKREQIVVVVVDDGSNYNFMYQVELCFHGCVTENQNPL
jgi:hypothetical protein